MTMLTYFKNPLNDEVQELDLHKPGQIKTVRQLFPRATFALIALPTGDTGGADFEHGLKLVDAKKIFSEVFKHATVGLAKEEAIAAAKSVAAEKVAEAEKVADETQLALADAMKDQNMALILELSGPYHAAREEIESIGKALETEIEKIKTGKRAKNGNGDRSNPLPEFDSTNAIMRGKNGDKVLALRGDAIPNYETLGLSENWQAFQIAQTGQHKGYWQWKGTLGEQSSWTGLNNCISVEILDNAGSDGVNGLEAISAENLETIRTTQLRGLSKS